MAQQTPAPRPPGSPLMNRGTRRNLLLVVGLAFLGLGAYGLVTDETPRWVGLEPEAFPARVEAIRFRAAVIAPGKSFKIAVKRRGRRRKEPPLRISIALGAAPVARYRCRKGTRCPWITLAPLACREGEGKPAPCAIELMDWGRTPLRLMKKPRCALTRPGAPDIKLKCPHNLKLGAKLKK